MRRTRKACSSCGKVTMHLDGKPYASHLRSAQHRASVVDRHGDATLLVVVPVREDGSTLVDVPRSSPPARGELPKLGR